MKRSSTVRITSGFRASFIGNPAEQTEAWSGMLQLLNDEPFPTFASAMMDEEFYVDDWLKGLAPSVLLYNAMQSGELFACMYGQRLAAIVLLTNIVREREATMEAWVLPEFRGHYCVWMFWKDIIGYAFRRLRVPDDGQNLGKSGLGLRKLKAWVSAANTQAIKACGRMGFYQVGQSPGDGLFSGKLTDMLILELPNPICFPQVATNEKWRKRSETPYVRSASSLRGPGPVHSTAGPEQDDPERVDANRSNDRRKRRRVNAPAVDADNTGPDEPARRPAVRKSVVSAKRRPANRK